MDISDLGKADGVSEGDLLWVPSEERVERAQLTQYRQWLAKERGLTFGDFQSLWRWSVEDKDAFWRSIWDYFEVISDTPLESVMARGNHMIDTRWFEGTRTNYAEHVLRHERVAAPGTTALCHSSEIRPMTETSWQELGAQVRALATALRGLGVKPGDRIVSYMPNTLETAVALLATAAIGAIWSSAAPEFGVQTVVDRFSQIAPKILFAADGYSFNGRIFDRRKEIAEIASNLPELETIIALDYVGLGLPGDVNKPVIGYADLLAGAAVDRDDFRYERVPPDHPLWVLFSSGTTGLPKAIVHGHAGTIAEQLKVSALHSDYGPNSRVFFYSTTGWMMWNSVISSLMTGAAAVLYDGSPVNGGLDMLWHLAQASGATVFGASPTLVQNMKAAGFRPADQFDLPKLETVFLGGAPATPDVFQWFYENVKDDVWVVSQSGGTEICSGLVCGAVTEPTYAAEIQTRALGMDVHVWNDAGTEIIDSVGELVVTDSMPTAPLFFWGDEKNARYMESYYSSFPGVWRHGDLAKINARGGVYIYGRSDSTLNRFGVRIGTAEIYSVLEQLPGIADSLIVCCDTQAGGYYMPLFVALKDGVVLTEELKETITKSLRVKASPRHVPDDILDVPMIPYTLTGKKMEVPIRKIVSGVTPEKAASRDTMREPALLDWFIAFANRSEVRERLHGG